MCLGGVVLGRRGGGHGFSFHYNTSLKSACCRTHDQIKGRVAGIRPDIELVMLGDSKRTVK